MALQKKKKVPADSDGGKVGQELVDTAMLGCPGLRGKLPSGQDYIRAILQLHLSGELLSGRTLYYLG